MNWHLFYERCGANTGTFNQILRHMAYIASPSHQIQVGLNVKEILQKQGQT